MTCACRVRGNQYGSWLATCEYHGTAIVAAAAVVNLTPEEFVNRAISEALGSC